MEYFIVAGLSSWRSSPLTWVWIRSSSNGGISSIGTSHGPIEPVFGQFLPWVDIELAQPHPVTDRAFVAERHAGDVRTGLGHRDAAARLPVRVAADDDDDLALVVELLARVDGSPAARAR